MIIEYPLKRCSHCNQKPIIRTDPDHGHSVYCENCDFAVGSYTSIERAVHEWNSQVREFNLLLERAD